MEGWEGNQSRLLSSGKGNPVAAGHPNPWGGGEGGAESHPNPKSLTKPSTLNPRTLDSKTTLNPGP